MNFRVRLFLVTAVMLSTVQLASAQWVNGGTKVTTTDNVGIGTSTPATKLHVVGKSTLNGDVSVDGSIKIDNGDSNGGNLVLKSRGNDTWTMDNSAGVFRLYQTDADNEVLGFPFFIDANTRKIGIGSPALHSKLQVAVNSLFNGDVSIDGKLNTSAFSTGSDDEVTFKTSKANTGLLINHGPTRSWLGLFAGSFNDGSFNPISKSRDYGILFGESKDTGTGGLVIAPWSGSASGFRMDNHGEATFSTGHENQGLLVHHSPSKSWLGLFAGSFGAGAFNPLSKNKDYGILFGESKDTGTGGLVIAPWSGSASGFRMDNHGEATFSTGHENQGLLVHHSPSKSWLGLFAGSFGASAFNPLSKNKDYGIIFGEGRDVGNAGLVIAPWRGTRGGIRIDNEGNVEVPKTILASRVKVAALGGSNWNWSDFVFDKNYKLKPLLEVEEYISHNHHLEGVPTTEEVNKDGVDVVPVMARLLQKIEELTLYVIDLKHENELQQKELEKLREKLK